jgi:DNA-binding NtrC family response regulator
MDWHSADVAQLLPRADDSSANVLVVGGDKVFREGVALRVHRTRRQKGLFTYIRCDDNKERLRVSFLGFLRALTRQASGCNRWETPLLWGGTLFLDPIDKMDIGDQRTCLELLKELQRRRNEWPGRESVRVVAGVSTDFSHALTEGNLLQGLVDILDKVRVVANDNAYAG